MTNEELLQQLLDAMNTQSEALQKEIKAFGELVGIELPELMSAKELKEYLHCNNNTVYGLINRRDFPSFKIGRKTYINKNKFLICMEKESKKRKSV